MTAHVQPPFQISAPFTMTLKPVAGQASGQFQIVNTGSQPIKVQESAGRLSPLALQYPAASGATAHHMGTPWITLDGPASFILAPGQAETVHISAHVPAGAQGNHYLNLIWTASPVKTVSGPLHLHGAVATTAVIPLPGIAVPVGPDRLPHAPLAPGHGLSTIDLGGIGLAAALIAAVAGLVIRRRRSARRAARAQEVTA